MHHEADMDGNSTSGRAGQALAVRAGWLAWALLGLLACASELCARDPLAVARRVDELLREEIPYVGGQPERIDDARFLRRASLDVRGRLPTPEELTAFVLDPSPDKRQRLVERLLADPQYGVNWGRYWRDVIMYRKTEERQQFLVGIPLEEYLAESFNRNKPFSQVAREFLTATGGANENGACALIVAQQGQPEEIAGEVSRIFLGVQIQCAQCHDHPTDRWTREQFHQLAAFFPRVATRPSSPQDPRRELTVTVTDLALPRLVRGPMNMRFRGTPEHYMPDLKNPQSQGTLMQPVFFLTGQQLPVGTRDAERRGRLADWITQHPYFAKALVNRLWSELTGEGFYEPVDDMGPDREGVALRTLDYLAGEFAASGHDLKWLFRVILATERYQLPSAPRRGPEEAPMQHNVAQRLRADQVFDNLLLVLELSEPAPPAGAGPLAGRFARAPRRAFEALFGYDPSTRRDEIQSSIPQVLALMNWPPLAAAIRATGNTMLARQLAALPDDEALIGELYLRVLGRPATRSELATCQQYLREVNNRTEAFEDILWSLLNSAEFLHRT
jgi:hypothetical protein